MSLGGSQTWEFWLREEQDLLAPTWWIDWWKMKRMRWACFLDLFLFYWLMIISGKEKLLCLRQSQCITQFCIYLLLCGEKTFLSHMLKLTAFSMFWQVIVVDNYFTGSKDNLRKWIGHPRFELIRHGINLVIISHCELCGTANFNGIQS